MKRINTICPTWPWYREHYGYQCGNARILQ